MTQHNQMRQWHVHALIIVLAIIAQSIIVHAAGVSSPYWDLAENKNPLYLEPGHSKDIKFILQNGGGGTEDIAFKVRIIEGQNIATLIDNSTTYVVPAGATDVPVNVRVALPKNAPLNTTYSLKFEFTSAPVVEQGSFQFGSAFVQRFNVIAAAPQASVAEERKNPLYAIIGVALAVIIIAIVVALRRRQK